VTVETPAPPFGYERVVPSDSAPRSRVGASLGFARDAIRRALRTPPGRLGVAAWARTFGWRRADLFELDRPAGSVPPSRASYPAGYAFRRAGLDEAAACSRVTNVPVAEILRRHEAGDACYVVARGSRVATVLWVHEGPCYVRGLGYVHDGTRDEKYVYGVVTDPTERGKGLYRNAVEDLAARLFSEGATRLVRIVEAGNTPVLVTIARLGFRRSRTIACLLVLGVKRTVVTDAGRGGGERAWRILPPRDRFVI
jgi:GNAT superfamily N-acetyltransferase